MKFKYIGLPQSGMDGITGRARRFGYANQDIVVGFSTLQLVK